MVVKCPNCQFENREGVKFCEKCGTKLELACPRCKAKIPLDREFCGECGHSLVEAKAPSPVDYTRPQTYTPKFLADKILKERNSLQGERKLVTVLFADVANYTSMSEKLDAEEVHQIMDGCFQILMDEIHRYEGTINQFTGDGVMALFGAPVAHEDHAQRACHAALAIQRAMGKYGEKLEKDYGVDFKMRIGLNSGPVVVGSIGNDLRMDYTAQGDTSNLASRMQTMAEPGTILVARETHKMTRDFFRFKSLGRKAVKGKEEAVEVYDLVEPTEVLTRIEAAMAKGLTRFVGRETEMAALKEAFEKSKSGSGQVVGIVGEAGVGKSRLLLEMQRLLPEGRCTYLQGRCLHYGSYVAYLPFLDMLRTYFDIKEGDPESLVKNKIADKIGQLDEKLKAASPSLEDILSLKVEDETYINLDAPLRRMKVFEAIRDLLIRESQRRSLVIVVEDLHWVDKTSEELLGYLIGSLADIPIMLILLYRPEYTHCWGSISHYRQIDVEQLSLASSAILVQSILEEGQVVPELNEVIVNRAAGNPLFMEEVTHALLENGTIGKKDHKYVLTRRASEIQVPDTIQGIIAARMDRLEENTKRTMQVASVIGRDFAFAILQAVTGAQRELRSHLSGLQKLGLLYETSPWPEPRYRFKHALTQEVAYNSLLLKKRREIHQKIGEAIEDLFADRPEDFSEALAYHYMRARNHEKAYHYLKLSGDRAARSYSNQEANRLYRQAIEAVGQLPQTEQNKRRGVEVRLSLALPMLNSPEDCFKILEDGVALAKELDDRLSLAKLYSWIGMYNSVSGNPILGIQYTENSFDEAESIKAIEVMAPSAFHLCSSYFFTGENCPRMIEVASKTIALLEETQRQSESFGTMNPYAMMYSYYGTAMDMLGRFQQGQTAHERALAFALGLGDLNVLTLVENNYGWCLVLQRGDAEKAADHLRECVRHGEEASVFGVLGAAQTGLGWAYWMLGQLEDAEAHIGQGMKIQKDTGVTYLMSLHQCAMSLLCFDLGDFKRAHSYAQEALASSRDNHERFMEGLSWALLGRTLGRLNKSEYAAAERHVLQGVKILDELNLNPLAAQARFYLGELHLNGDQESKGIETLRKAQAMFREMRMDYWLARTEKALERLKA